MAQNRADGERADKADAKKGGPPPLKPEVPAKKRPSEGAAAIPASDPGAAVDQLLSMTETGWDIDEQVRTLKIAARPASPPAAPPPLPRVPSVILPTPSELARPGGPRGTASDEAVTVALAAFGSGEAPTQPLIGKRPPPLPPAIVKVGAGAPPPTPAAPPVGYRANAPPPRRPPPIPPSVSSSRVPVPASSASPLSEAKRAAEARPELRAAGPLDPLADLLAARIASLQEQTAQEGESGRGGLGRAHLELSLAEALRGDLKASQRQVELALAADPTLASAHALERRIRAAEESPAEALAHLDQELLAASSEAGSVELLVSRARLLQAGGDPRGARTAWETALARSPLHPGALKGLEAHLTGEAYEDDGTAASHERSAQAFGALAEHLSRMADAYGSQPDLAAWLHVERALILERRLGKVDLARGAFEKAIALHAAKGPVRNEYGRFLAAHGDASALATLLEGEAELETGAPEAVARELEAARLFRADAGDPRRAILVLERAARRAASPEQADLRVLDALLELYAEVGNWADAARTRRARLAHASDPLTLAFELRALALEAERVGDRTTAIADVQRALLATPGDASLVTLLDRLLAAEGRSDARIALWLGEANRAGSERERARMLLTAANLAASPGPGEKVTESGLAEAKRHLRAAWVASPGDPEVLDGLARLLAPSTLAAASPQVDETRALMDLYEQAAARETDRPRRIAYLEKVALLAEDVLGDAPRAARTHDEVLALDPDNRGAWLGVSRVAARTGDDRALARALLEEAKRAGDEAAVLKLKTRAAAALAKVDATRALGLVREVLSEVPSHGAARALETRLHEEAGRWEAAVKSLRERVEFAEAATERQRLWVALSQVQEVRLRAPLEALASLQKAHEADPAHPLPLAEIARVLGATGGDAARRAALGELAAKATSPSQRARYLSAAAEIEETKLSNDAAACELYTAALDETPDDSALAARLARGLARRASADQKNPARGGAPPSPAPLAPLEGVSALETSIEAQRERTKEPVARRALAFQAALLLEELGDLGRAETLIESVLAEEPNHAPALRVAERVAVRSADERARASAQRRQAAGFVNARARLGALRELLSRNPEPASYATLLELDPGDPVALEAVVRAALLADAKRGDRKEGRARALEALRVLRSLAPDDGTRLTLELAVGLLSEAALAAGDDGAVASGEEPAARDALECYRRALALDPLSVTAATGLARVATRLADAHGAVAASVSLADLAGAPRTRARYLLEAAELLLSPGEDPRLGARPARRTRALALLESAVDADADFVPAAARLSTLRLEDKDGARLLLTFRAAAARARAKEAIVMLGSEIARVSRDELGDLPTAIEAMRRVRAAVPDHVPSLLTLAEVCIAQRAWPEAVDALEAVGSTSREDGPRLTALFALASIFEKVLARPGDAEKALRQALAIDPQSARALRALVHALALSSPARGARRDELSTLIARLAELENDPVAKRGLLLQLSELRLELGDAGGAESALVDAVAHAPRDGAAFARLAALFRRGAGGERDDVGYARALLSLIGRGQRLGTLEASWFATLGQLEIVSLNRLREGIAHLERAVQLDPSLFETRFELGEAQARAGAHAEAARTLLGLLVPSARPLVGLSDPPAALAQLEAALVADHRADDAAVIVPLRALAGDLDDTRHAALLARRWSPSATPPELDRPTLVTSVLPPEGRHVLLEVAAAIAGLESKVARADLAEVGISARDRVGSRSGHPTRALLDRLGRVLGLDDIELVVGGSGHRVRVVAPDTLWVVVPRAFAELPEPRQVAGLARALSRIALGTPWIDELSSAQTTALLVAAARQVAPGYASDDPEVLALVPGYEAMVSRALGRRQRKLLEELAPHIQAPQGRPLARDAFVTAVAKGEVRAAYLLSGDLLATLEELRARDTALLGKAPTSTGVPLLAALLEHPLGGDLVRFALTREAAALLQRLRG